MKKVLLSILLGIVAAFGLAACGGNAIAGTLTQNFVADDGRVFVVQDALSVEKVANAVLVTGKNGTTYSYPDATGALFTKILNSAGFSSHFIQVAGTLQYVNTTVPVYIMCFTGKTYFADETGPGRYFNDGCALVNAIRAASN